MFLLHKKVEWTEPPIIAQERFSKLLKGTFTKLISSNQRSAYQA